MPLYRRLPLTTRGDLLTRDASNNTRIAIGSTGKVLHTDGTDPTWQALVAADIPNLDASKLTSGQLAVAQGGTGVSAVPSFFVHKNGTSQTGIVANTLTKMTWSTETYDTNSNFASDKFTPTVAGKYLLICNILWDNTTADQVELLTGLYKNGSILLDSRIRTSGANQYQLVILTTIVDANGSTDNFEIYAKHSDVANRTVYGGAANTWWTGVRVAT
jgi:hypothetical protein